MPLLSVDQASRTYDGAVPVHALQPTTFQIESGDFVSIVGKSGSGKSTLMNLLGLLDRPSAGSYAVGGFETTILSEKDRAGMRAQWFGFVFQAFHLLSDRTTLENVEIGALYLGIQRRDRKALAMEALGRVGMLHRKNAVPGTLSGGERQRAAIARAVMARPPVLLCDEPTGNLDQENASNVLDLLEELNESGQTLLVVTHDRDVAQRARSKLHVVDGIVEQLP